MKRMIGLVAVLLATGGMIVAAQTPQVTPPAPADPLIIEGDGVTLAIDSILLVPESLGQEPSTENILVLFQGRFKATALRCISTDDIRLILDDEEYPPDLGLTAALQDTLSVEADYSDFISGQCLDAGGEQSAFFVMDVPLTARSAVLRYDGAEVDLSTWPPEAFAEAPARGESYIVLRSATVRTCPRTTCTAVTRIGRGETISVIKTTTGDAVSGNRLWHEVYVDSRRTGFVHSSYVRSTNATPTPASQPPIRDATSTAEALQSTPDPSAQSKWVCTGDLYNCGDFETCDDLLDYFETCPGDPSKLDANKDDRPCESRCF